MFKKCTDIIVKDRIRKNVNDSSVADLVAAILKEGLINPITITKDNRLVAGERRLEAYKILNKEEIEVTVIDEITDEKLFDIEAEENLQRRSFVLTELYEVAKRKEIFVAAEAEIRMKKGKAEPCATNGTGSKKKNKKTIEIIADYIGMGKTNYRKLKDIMEYEDKENFTWDNKGVECNYQELLNHMDNTGKVATAYNKLFPKESKEKEVVEETVTTDNNEELLKVIAEKDKIIAEKEETIGKLKYVLDKLGGGTELKGLPAVSKESLKKVKAGIMKVVHPDISGLDKNDSEVLTHFFKEVFDNTRGI